MTTTATAPDAARSMTTVEFFALVREGRLVVQQCAVCGALAVPPKVVCPSCEGVRWDRAALGGDGEIASYTVIRVPPAQHASGAPYVIAVVRMAEGVSLLGRLTGVSVDGARVGLPVRFAGSAANAEPPVITFRPR
jgi:3-oxo-4,17-pregnadiene-20-carboxyl-CoA hydratase alpha subunit